MVQFNIGKTNPEYVIAEFDDEYTTCSIYKNGEDSDGLTKDFVHPTSDPEYPIYKHRATLKTVTVQEGIVGLGGNAFAMTSITSISLPSTLKSIGVGCFNVVKTLTSIVLPNGLEQINRGAFQNCSNLQTIYLDEVSDADPATRDILPSSLKLLDKQAFYNCTSLEGRITVPSGVTTVGQHAFDGCSSLNGTVEFQNGVEEIGGWAFDRCAHVTGGITFPTSIKKIGPYAFQNCGFNGVITLNEGLESIGDGAFNQCAYATNTTFTIPSTLTTIGGDTYAEVTETTATITVSDEGNTGIGSHVFYNFATKTCDEFVVSRGNQHFKAVDGVLMSLDGTRLVAYPPSKNGTSYEIPEGVVKIDEMAFSRTSRGSAAQKLSTITLPNSYVIKTTDQETNILNRASGNSLSVALYTFNQVSSVEVKSDNPQYVSINGCLYSKNGLALYYVPVYKSGSLRLSSLVNTATLGAFYGFEKTPQGVEVYSQLTELIIPRYLTNVPNYEVTRMNNFLQAGHTITVEDGNPVLVVTGATIMKLQPFSTGGLISNVKLISSGNVPTTDNLFKGEMAFGKVNSDKCYHLYGNSDGSIVDYFDGVQRNFSVTYGKDIINKPVSVGNYGSSAISFSMNNTLIAGGSKRQVIIDLRSVYRADIYDATTDELQQSVNILSNFPDKDRFKIDEVLYGISMEGETSYAPLSELVEMMTSISSDITVRQTSQFSDGNYSGSDTKTQVYERYDYITAEGNTEEANEALNQMYSEISQFFNIDTLAGISYDCHTIPAIKLQGELLV